MFKPKLTKLGERHPITNNIGEKFKNNNWGNWSRYTKSKVISGKTLLHFNNDPLLVIDSIGEGRVAQILSDQSWIWKKSEKEKGPLVKLLRNTIHWLLKTPNMEEDFVSISKDDDKIKIKLNSINPGNLEAEVITPNKSKKNIILKDNKRGSIEGTFYSNGLGKYSIKYRR